MSDDGRAVLVTTQHRGVFFGYLSGDNAQNGIVTLQRARMAVYWSAKMRGVLGLAHVGPDDSCRISHAVQSIELNAVTAVVDCTPEATERWEKGPWK